MEKKSYNLLEKEFWLERKYALWAFFVPAYIAVFFLIENIIDGSGAYWQTQLPIDQMIPFEPGFILAYYMWYPLLVGVGLYGLIKEEWPFRRYMTLLAVTFFAAELFFLIVPNGQGLRPDVVVGNDLCSRMVKLIYSADTNTNVFPSVHVIGALVAFVGALDFKTIKHKKVFVAFIGLVSFMICISTVFVKQHSLLDVLGGAGFVAVGYVIVYIFVDKYVFAKKRKKREKNG